MQNRKELLGKIASIESQISLLNEAKVKLVSALSALPEDISSNKEHNISVFSVEHKIQLFRSLFRGRGDVYARFWKSRKTGKVGYNPVCKNEWFKGICNKPIMKCAQCPNRELVPFTDEVVLKHLKGLCVIGIYPMLKDETCYFLAVDFDGESWTDDVFAFAETCQQKNVPVAIERSRSGKGAHAWIFFEEKVPAALARRMGSVLITQTMSRRYQLDMKSYDRIFPNQDTLPKGGFGNLIALPFQKEAAISSNSLFIDHNCVPYPDQWGFLSELNKMSAKEVENIAKEAYKSGYNADSDDSLTEREEDSPWMKLPSGKPRYKPTIKDLPAEIELILANRIYIKTDNVPSVFLNQIKQLAVFQNPEFYKKQRMRLSTFLTPRIISCSEILDGYLAIPRGCFNDISYLMNEYSIKMIVKDERFAGKDVRFKFHGDLSKEQQAASGKILKNDLGVLVAPPGSGKTVLAAHAIAKRKTNVLILVHRKPLLEQWRLRLFSFLGVDSKDIGQIGGGKNKANGLLDVAMIQSMEEKGAVDDRIADYGFVIVDECHHVSAVSFEKVLMQAKAKYILGLTATPYRRDGHQPIIHMQCGPICYQKNQKDLKEQGFDYLIVPRITEFTCEWNKDSDIYALWPKLISDENRNRLIVNDIIAAVREGRFPIILTERKEHLEMLASLLEKEIDNLIVLHGGLRPKARKEMLKNLSACSPNGKKAILATGAYMGEGFDEPRLDTLFLTMPISFKGKVVQYTGRLHRKHSEKTSVKIYDYVDDKVPVLQKMYQRRLKTYKAIGYLDISEYNAGLAMKI